ncbi:5-oxoprolinase subunit PxpB [Paenibacillus xylanivorans]|uniref:Kinase inhibitor n=1 Tax=Paenibacillus xylanivorans TaxID=1705561 RepID=A0A0M9BS32_9BACL|nr:5-oxoprolinase subunit PxpB [Paenibacillus xylanivorans]KOY17679.1 kinase inhibitor [Paenibacillus xylanivorans]
MTELPYSWTEDLLSPLGETGVMIRCGDAISEAVHRRVMSVCALLEKSPIPGVIEWLPSFASVTLFYDPLISPYHEVCRVLLHHLNRMEEAAEDHSRTVIIPVCYGDELGPDLEHVATEHGLTPNEVIAIHTSGDYLVHMLGFAPGFPYLGGLSERIATPRRPTPRLRVEAGTVGIGGKQTGVYPVTTPGGWQCIGRTPLALFRPTEDPPSLLVAGDRVRFVSISIQEYLEQKEGER